MAADFRVVELPLENGIDTTAISVAFAGNSFMVVGTSYPNGPDGDTEPVAWLKIQDETDWVEIVPPPEAYEFVDVTENSVIGDGTVEARMLGQEGFVGDRFAVLGYDQDLNPAVWNYSLDGTWDMAALPGGTASYDNLLQQFIGAGMALSSYLLWTLEGGEWKASDLTRYFPSADAGVRLDFGEGGGGLMLTGGFNEDADGNLYQTFIHSTDGIATGPSFLASPTTTT